MSAYPEIDKIFGPAVPMTVKGKMQNTSTGWFVVTGMLIFVGFVGVMAIAKSFNPSGDNEEKKKPKAGA
jgi:hypothetical protein